jgi:phosphoribosylglycinamide formyltransferase
MLNIAVMVSGGGTNLQALINALKGGIIKNARISLVLSDTEGAYALKRAESEGIAAVCIAKKKYSASEFESSMLEALDKNSPGLIVLAGFLSKVPDKVIQKYRGRIINIHPSLIPSFCGKGFYGLKVHEAALKRGVKLTGATVHLVDEGIDSGKILIQKAVEVRAGDTPQLLQKRVMEEAEWIILPEAVNIIACEEIKLPID